MDNSVTEKQKMYMNKLGIKFTDSTTKSEAAVLIETHLKKNADESKRVKPAEADKGKYDLLPGECSSCGGAGYTLMEHRIYKSTTIGACDNCERGKYLQTREKHPLGSLSRCMDLGHVIQRNG